MDNDFIIEEIDYKDLQYIRIPIYNDVDYSLVSGRGYKANPDYGIIIKEKNNDNNQYLIYTDLLSKIVNIKGKFGQIFTTLSIDIMKSNQNKVFDTLYKDIINTIGKEIIQYSQKENINSSDFGIFINNLLNNIKIE